MRETERDPKREQRVRDRHTVRQTERENGERERGHMERKTQREEMEGWKMGYRERDFQCQV